MLILGARVFSILIQLTRLVSLLAEDFPLSSSRDSGCRNTQHGMAMNDLCFVPASCEVSVLADWVEI